jgi:putative endonuclease
MKGWMKIQPFFCDMFYCYIIYSKSADKFYVGYTADLTGRLKKHNAMHRGFTGKFNDWEFVFIEKFESKIQAALRERQIKSWKSRRLIIALLYR